MEVYRYGINISENSNVMSSSLLIDKELVEYIEVHSSTFPHDKYNICYDPVRMVCKLSCDLEIAKYCVHLCSKVNSSRPNSDVQGFSISDSFRSTLQQEEPKMPTKYNYNARHIPVPVKIINQGPATIVFWDDKTKTIVKCSGNDEFDPDMAITMACLKKMVGEEAYAAAKQMGHRKRVQNMIEWKI